MNTLIRLIIIFCLLISYTVQNAAQVRDRNKEILVYIQPGYFELPKGIAGQVTFENIATVSQKVSRIIQDNNILLFAKAFPEFMPSDTIVINEDGNRIKLPDMSRIFIFTLAESDKKDNVIKELSKVEGVLFAEKHVNWKTFDTRYPEQWSLNNTGQFGGTVDADIDAPEAWQITQGSSNIKVGIIDTGVETSHPDLTGKTTGDWPEDNCSYAYGHGTHVAGIVGAKVGGGSVLGVAPNTTLISKKVFHGCSGGEAIPDFDDVVYNKIKSAVDGGCSILNHSYGGEEWSYVLKAAYVYGYKMNRVSVCAMGNEYGTQTNYPAAYEQGIIAVGSTDINDQRPTYSNYGNHIDVSAPGGCCDPGANTSVLSTDRNSTYYQRSGTSMATPIVTGIAALLKAYNQNLANDDIEQIIRISADDKGATGWDQYFGTGRVNANSALKLLQAPYQFSQLSAYGGQDYSVSDYYQMGILGAPGLTDGTYFVKRHEVRKNVTFPARYDHYAWGRGYGTTGWSTENANFTMGFCEIVPGTLTSTSATLRTYVYEVWDLYSYRGYFPTTPQNVTFKYTVLGKPIVAPVIDHFVQSPNPICKGGSVGTVTAYLSQGSPTPTYTWTKLDGPASFYIETTTGNPCYVAYYNTGLLSPDEIGDALIRCTATNSGGTDIKNYIVRLVSSCPSCPTLAFNVGGEMTDDNPLLITSLSNPGVDVTDYYLIQNPVTPVGNKINLRIHEPQTEHTWLDYVELIEAKVKADELVAVNDEGEIVNYSNNTPVVSVFLNGTTDITEILSSMDTVDIDLNEGDIITIQRNIQAPENDGDGDLVLGGTDPIKDQESITLSLAKKEDTDGDNPKLADLFFFFRPNKSIIAKKLRNLPPGNLEITINQELTLNYLTIVRNLKTARVNSLSLLSANHSTLGNVKALLSSINQNYAEIFPGEIIDFEFQKGTIPADKIAYILKSVGRYETDTTSAFNKLAGTGEENLIPKENKLYDNYPNPFNPTTQIKYSVKENGLVILKVYDILGKELAALVNEEKQAGTYTVTFNAGSLASGIYFYTISANDYQKTKKMLLIK